MISYTKLYDARLRIYLQHSVYAKYIYLNVVVICIFLFLFFVPQPFALFTCVVFVSAKEYQYKVHTNTLWLRFIHILKSYRHNSDTSIWSKNLFLSFCLMQRTIRWDMKKYQQRLKLYVYIFILNGFISIWNWHSIYKYILHVFDITI